MPPIMGGGKMKETEQREERKRGEKDSGKWRAKKSSIEGENEDLETQYIVLAHVCLQRPPDCIGICFFISILKAHPERPTFCIYHFI